MCTGPELRFGQGGPPKRYGPRRRNLYGPGRHNLGEQLGLQPGLTYEEWLQASGLEHGMNSRDGYEAYAALTGNPIPKEGGEAPPAAPPGPAEFSLRIDRDKTGAGDLRIKP